MPIIGTEIEYAVIAPGHPELDQDVLAQAVIRHASVPATPCFEDSFSRMLGNGGRLYVDHGHPEYCTPETTSATDAVVWELAGDKIVSEAAEAASEELGVGVRLFRNNTDGQGNSYGYHENVLVTREVPWAEIERYLPTFLVTRIVYAGAGRLGLGWASEQPGFQLSQRADFFTRVAGLNTMANRGILNTRDEPHADAERWRRLHVITGDANRNPWASWLRLGTLALFIDALQVSLLPEVLLADPVAAMKTVSRDLSLSVPLPLVGGGKATAIQIQAAIANRVRPVDAEGDRVLSEWVDVLEALESEPTGLGDRLDWSARWELIRGYQGRLGCELDDPRLAALDLAWADLAASSPWERLRQAGRFVPWPALIDEIALEDLVVSAMVNPPTTTRAFARGRMIADHPERVVSADWSSVLLRGDRGRYAPFAMPEPQGWNQEVYQKVAAAPWLAGG